MTINDQWLSPASHDEKMVKMMGELLIINTDDYQDQNFSAGKGMKQATVYKKTGLNEDYNDLEDLYRTEAYEIVTELFDIVDGYRTEDSTSDVTAAMTLRRVVEMLRCSRDILIERRAAATESEIKESAISAGIRKLRDGSNVIITNEDASILNKMYESTEDKVDMVNELFSSRSNYKSMLKFATKSLNEEQLDENIYKVVGKGLARATVVTAGAVVGGAIGAVKGAKVTYDTYPKAVNAAGDYGRAVKQDANNLRDKIKARVGKYAKVNEDSGGGVTDPVFDEEPTIKNKKEDK